MPGAIGVPEAVSGISLVPPLATLPDPEKVTPLFVVLILYAPPVPETAALTICVKAVSYTHLRLPTKRIV